MAASEAASSIEALTLGANAFAQSSSRTEVGSLIFKASVSVWRSSNWISSRRMSETNTPLAVLAYSQDEKTQLDQGELILVNNQILQTTSTVLRF